ncbi:hypothetical protein QMZ05_34585 [Bradyrhizobium sp. INPA03-11B]|uniref:hypothetical protein n=1 Tax=Bradyrhizobium sp. INPA03-11B TaxID=418598 RepID=UPI00338F8EE6
MSWIKVNWAQSRYHSGARWPGHIMTNSSWTEILRCPKCRRTGHAELFEIAPFRNRILKVSEDFEIRTDERGSDFQCRTCKLPALP